MSGNSGEQMLDVFIFETEQNVGQLEAIVLESEKSGRYSEDAVNEVFRIMHTIKGSAAMMMFGNLSSLAHGMEDLFFYLREYKPKKVDYSVLSDLVLAGVDFIKAELQKIKGGAGADGDVSPLTGRLEEFLKYLQAENGMIAEGGEEAHKFPETAVREDEIRAERLSAYEAVLYFDDGCEMESVRAYGVVRQLRGFVDDLYYYPGDILENDDSVEIIRKQGFTVGFSTRKPLREISSILQNTLFLKDLELRAITLEQFKEIKEKGFPEREEAAAKQEAQKAGGKRAGAGGGDRAEDSISLPASSMISVNVAKLDKLMDLVGEMVIAEAMVTQNPDLQGLELENFGQAARQLQKITREIQDIVMSLRMVPLTTTFLKMQRVVRDTSRKVGKEVRLRLIGENTEVDKNIIENISDPLMHLIRNAIDHGLEEPEIREALGKERTGTVTLEARNDGNYVVVSVRDDGRGLDKEKILRKARRNNLLSKPEDELTDKEIYSLIFLPGFSTSEQITELSGRGVGMDVVKKNLESIGGTVAVDSKKGRGTVFTLKIPLTLAIIEGMKINVGNSLFIIPINDIRETVRLTGNKIIVDPDGNEMIMVRDSCYPIIRLSEFYSIPSAATKLEEGVFILTEHDDNKVCFFVDELLGQQEVVVKALPGYLRRRRIRGISGCTLLGDGSISLILDVGGFVN